MKKIVIVGGGFAGINTAMELANTEGFHITLVDKNNYNFFPPLLYQVSTGFLEPSNISYPFRKMFHNKKNLHFRLGELLKINSPENKIILSSGELEYDYLVLATGTVTNFFGMENIQKNTLPMKTINDALELRNYLFQRLEAASIAAGENEKKKLSTVVIAGGGPTGVELAGMLSEMYKNILGKDYPELAGLHGDIYLMDASATLLAPMSISSQKYTYETLIKMGVKVRLNMQVKDYAEDSVMFANGEKIETKILIWAAGVTAQTMEGISPESYGKGKRLMVDAFNKVIGTNNMYAIGDTCIQTTDKNYPTGHPQLAQVAIQQGRSLAKSLKAILENRPPAPFTYHDKGTMAIIGRNKAVADIPKPRLQFTGFVAWFLWIFVHLVSLISYRNRIKTLYNWMLSYFTKDQSLRIIVRPIPKP